MARIVGVLSPVHRRSSARKSDDGTLTCGLPLSMLRPPRNVFSRPTPARRSSEFLNGCSLTAHAARKRGRKGHQASASLFRRCLRRSTLTERVWSDRSSKAVKTSRSPPLAGTASWPTPSRSSYDEMPYINRAFSADAPGSPRDPRARSSASCRPTSETLPRAGIRLRQRRQPDSDGDRACRTRGSSASICRSARSSRAGSRSRPCASPTSSSARSDIANVDASWGTFDYILCHGIYSWVPAPIRREAPRDLPREPRADWRRVRELQHAFPAGACAA